MSMVCDVTGTAPQFGNHVSHAQNKTRRRFQPNLHVKKFWVQSRGCHVRLKVSLKGLRLIDKLGIEKVLDMIEARKKTANS